MAYLEALRTYNFQQYPSVILALVDHSVNCMQQESASIGKGVEARQTQSLVLMRLVYYKL